MIETIIEALEAFKDEQRIAFAKKSHPTQTRVIGVTSPNQKIVLKQLQAQCKGYSNSEKIALAIKLVDTAIFECQHLAYEFLGKDKKALAALSSDTLNQLCKNLDNWVLVDAYAGYLVGYAWREQIIPTSKIRLLFNSKDFWRRRIALVATVSLNQKARGGTGDAKRTLEICTLAVNDHTDLINKALSWALRELAKIEPAPVEMFLQKHQASLHPRVLKEVYNKLQHGTKN